MEGFAIVRNASGLFQTLREEGYTSKQRGGSPGTMTGLRVLHVTIVRGADLPPHAIAQWMGDGLAPDTYTSREFASQDELQAWLTQWGVILGDRCRKL